MSIVANARSALRARLERFFPFGYGSSKHDFAKDYGWPDVLSFEQFYRMYCRSGLAAAGVDKTIAKTWQSYPNLWESEKPAESEAEGKIRKHFARKKIWRSMMEADRRSMVGCYAGAIILVRDSLALDQPVGRVRPGIESLVGIIPAWEGQLIPIEWDQDQTSETYGEPLRYQFNEQAVGDPSAVGKSQISIHRDRVLIWSDDGTVNCASALEPGFNDLSDAAKIKGAGGEGFWKSARGAPIVEAKDGQNIETIMKGMGFSTPEQAKQALDDKADDFQSGFDKFLMMGGFSVKPLNITLPQPKEFWELAAQGFAASISIPVKVLIGNVTGERASTEDANEWAQTNMSRRENRVLPILYDFIERLMAWGVLEQKDWTIGWDSLQEASPDDKLSRAEKMANINSTLTSEPAFLPDEIREAAGFKPADEVEGFAEYLADQEQRRQEQAEDAATQTIPDEVRE